MRDAARDAGVEVCLEPVLLGSAGGLGHVRDRAAEHLAVWNGDILADPPWERFLEAHKALASDLSWLLIPHPGGPWNPVWLARDGRILPPGETGAGPYHFCGTRLLGPRALALLPEEGPADTKAHVLPRLDGKSGSWWNPSPILSRSPGRAHRGGGPGRPGTGGPDPRLLRPSHGRTRRRPPPVHAGTRRPPPPACRDQDAFWFEDGGHQVRLAL